MPRRWVIVRADSSDPAPHARSPSVQSDRPAARAGRHPLVRPDLSRRLRPVPLARVRCASGSPTGPRQAGRASDVEDLLFYGVLGRRHRRAPRLRAVLQAGLLRGQPARDLRGVEGRHGVPRRPARRDRGDGAVRARARPSLPAGHRPDRAVRAHRAGVRPHRQLHQRRAVGACRRSRAAVGDGLSAVGLDGAAASVAAVPVPARRPAAVRAAVAVCAQAARASARCRACS